MFILSCIYSNRKYTKPLFRHLIRMIILFILFVFNSCISQFIPSAGISSDLLVVEGLITDQPGQNIIKLSLSMPLGGRSIARPLSGGSVTVSDDMGNDYNL